MDAKGVPEPGRCPECGATARDGMSCRDRLGLLLAWESDDPALAAEHFLTVACYNLQHPAQFTDAAIAGLGEVFIAHLDRGLPVAEIRRRVGTLARGQARVLRVESERRSVLRHWSMTIADVAVPDQPEGAAGRVRDWAASIRREL